MTKFEQFGRTCEVLARGPLNDEDIDTNLPAERIWQRIRHEYLRVASVAVVSIGAENWERKHFDKEFGSSIRKMAYNSLLGLLGALVPTYPRTDRSTYIRHSFPMRRSDNIESEFSTIEDWADSHTTVQEWIHDTYVRKSTKQDQ